ncbi:MAG TPA: AAA family ATPase, partial [Methanosarcina sp.]|nr:AAA family ATPase [Methanosarcina sp.]
FRDEPVKIYTLKDLIAMRKSKRSKYYVTGLFQAGLYLVVAQAKTGKSLLGYNLANSLCRGNPFLNRKTIRSNVLIVQNEEELSSTGQKIENNGLQELQRENPEEYQALIESHRLIVTKGLDIAVDLQKILDIIDEYQVNCLIVDSFRASIGKGGLTEYDIGAASALYQLQSAVHDRSMLCVVIHHANKSDNNSGKTAAFNGVGGHNALTGANDGVIKLALNSDKRVDGKETVDIKFFPRNDNPCTFNVVYNEGEACAWGFDVIDESTLSDAMVASICAVLNALYPQYREWCELDEEDRPGKIPGKTIEQLVLDTGIERPALVKILNYMDHNEAIEKYTENRKWIYNIPAG